MAQRRVVITGIGAVSSLGMGAKALWEGARDGRSGVRETRFVRSYPGRIKISAQVPSTTRRSTSTRIRSHSAIR